MNEITKDPWAELLNKFPQPGATSLPVTTSSTTQADPAMWTSRERLILSSTILTFGFLLFLIMAALLWKKHQAMDIIRVCSLPLIIVSAIYLVVVGYTADQIAPVLGILGSIAGYLLGTAQKDHGKPP